MKQILFSPAIYPFLHTKFHLPNRYTTTQQFVNTPPIKENENICMFIKIRTIRIPQDIPLDQDEWLNRVTRNSFTCTGILTFQYQTGNKCGENLFRRSKTFRSPEEKQTCFATLKKKKPGVCSGLRVYLKIYAFGRRKKKK